MQPFRSWLGHRVQEVPDAMSVALARSGTAGGGVSRDRLLKVTRISPDVLDSLLWALVVSGQVVMVKAGGRMVYGANG